MNEYVTEMDAVKNIMRWPWALDQVAARTGKENDCSIDFALTQEDDNYLTAFSLGNYLTASGM